ncbi:hypothetical protein A1354_15935 [Pseudomonas asplenii]|jgi:hypothetical protein|nr:hypothetical protein A1354_15935 [Pseudomonas asplenii]
MCIARINARIIWRLCRKSLRENIAGICEGEGNFLNVMNSRELAERLLEEGCNPFNYSIGSRGAASDVFCLSCKGTQWQVCYTERGEDSQPIYVSSSESHACEFFFHHIMAMRHDHCVGFFKSKANAVAFEHELRALGVAGWSDQIPLGGQHDLRYRFFVTGKAIFAVRDAFGILPQRDTDA